MLVPAAPALLVISALLTAPTVATAAPAAPVSGLAVPLKVLLTVAPTSLMIPTATSAAVARFSAFASVRTRYASVVVRRRSWALFGAR